MLLKVVQKRKFYMTCALSFPKFSPHPPKMYKCPPPVFASVPCIGKQSGIILVFLLLCGNHQRADICFCVESPWYRFFKCCRAGLIIRGLMYKLVYFKTRLFVVFIKRGYVTMGIACALSCKLKRGQFPV